MLSESWDCRASVRTWRWRIRWWFGSCRLAIGIVRHAYRVLRLSGRCSEVAPKDSYSNRNGSGTPDVLSEGKTGHCSEVVPKDSVNIRKLSYSNRNGSGTSFRERRLELLGTRKFDRLQCLYFVCSCAQVSWPMLLRRHRGNTLESTQCVDQSWGGFLRCRCTSKMQIRTRWSLQCWWKSHWRFSPLS